MRPAGVLIALVGVEFALVLVDAMLWVLGAIDFLLLTSTLVGVALSADALIVDFRELVTKSSSLSLIALPDML